MKNPYLVLYTKLDIPYSSVSGLISSFSDLSQPALFSASSRENRLVPTTSEIGTWELTVWTTLADGFRI